MEYKRHFVAYYYMISFNHISLGLHIHLSSPNIEIHLPFGFIKIGFVKTIEGLSKVKQTTPKGFICRTFGYKGGT